MPGLLAQIRSVRFEEAMLTYVIITFFYLALVTLIALVVTNIGRRLILLGLLTVVASIGFGIVDVPSGAMVAPTMTKLGSLMVFGGVVYWLLPSMCDSEPSGKARAYPQSIDLPETEA